MTKLAAKILFLLMASLMLAGCQSDDAPILPGGTPEAAASQRQSTQHAAALRVAQSGIRGASPAK